MPDAIEQRANAFVRRAVEAFEPAATKEGVEGIAKHLRAGRLVVLHHLTNQGFVNEMGRQRLESQPSPLA